MRIVFVIAEFVTEKHYVGGLVHQLPRVTQILERFVPVKRVG